MLVLIIYSKSKQKKKKREGEEVYELITQYLVGHIPEPKLAITLLSMVFKN
jgi:hypothetical protein